MTNPSGYVSYTVMIRAANNGTALTDASIEVPEYTPVWYEQDQNNPAIFHVTAQVDYGFMVYCPNYQNQFVYCENDSQIYVDMAYIGSWPQTY
jgi:hypothetical protein